MNEFLDPRVITGNRAVVEKSEMDLLDIKTQHAQSVLRRVGNELRPFGSKYLGSVALHFYSVKDESNEKAYTTLEQCQLNEVNEGLADFGMKQLRTAMMACYGHQPARMVKR